MTTVIKNIADMAMCVYAIGVVNVVVVLATGLKDAVSEFLHFVEFINVLILLAGISMLGCALIL